MPEIYRTTRRVEFADTDMAGIVHFSNFFRYMEAAEVEFLRSRGLSVKFEWDGEPISFPRVAASCDFDKPAYFGDLLGIAVQIERLGRKSVTYAFEFSKNGEVIARGRVASCCCRVMPDHGIEPIEIPVRLRAILVRAV
jgi:YbgC/YbaW family acyl-CoA thioester hydrolase